MAKKLLGIVPACLLFGPWTCLAQTTIDFEDLTGGLVSTQYASKGATFNFPTARNYSSTPGFAHSGNMAVELCFAAEFCKAQLVVNFTAGQGHVKVFTGYTSALSQASSVLLRALDQNGVLVQQATAVLGPSNSAIPVQIPLEVVSASLSIRQITVGFASSDAFNNGLVFDDLEFAAGPPPVCTTSTNPVVTLSQPQNGEVVQINEFLLQGAVSTAAPLSDATLTVIGPGGNKTSSILGTFVQTAGGPFGATRVDESLFAGTNTVTVSARNCHGSGQASKTVIYGPVTNGTVIKLLGMEITQGTQDLANSVPMIAGKPTFVRLYFSTTGSPSSISGVRGDLEGFEQGGNTPFLATSIGTALIDSSQDVNAKRLDLTRSVNFQLSPDFFAAGLLNFRVIRLNIDGPGGATLACSGCANWQASFSASRPLNLIVAPFQYLFSNLTADAGDTVMGGLGWLNNVYPIGGNFPADRAGVNLIQLLPTQPTNRRLCTACPPVDRDLFMSDLQDILNDLRSQPGSNLPSDVRLFGMLPCGCGGQANLPGEIAFGDTWATENGPVPSANLEGYGAIWAQEIGHTFGRLHASNSHGEMPPTDPNFPYAHGGIGEPGLGIGTEWWNGSPFVLDPGVPADHSKHAHDFMSYGAPNDPDDHTHSWVSPYTYEGLLHSFQGPTQAPAPSDVSQREVSQRLVIGGLIATNNAATLRPFHIVNTGFSTGSGASGDFSVDFVDGGGQTLLTYRFIARTLANSSSLTFNEFVPWKAGTKEIVLKHNQNVLATQKVSEHAPSVRVTAPKSGQTWGAKATVTWQASDSDHDKLTYTVFYNNGIDQRWVPVATNVTALSVTVKTGLLVGSKRARVRVRATDGVNTTEADSGTFTVPENPPAVSILGKTAAQHPASQGVDLYGAAYDPKDGLLPAASLVWTSDRDGLLGKGQHVKTKPLSVGTHVITLTATNSLRHSAAKRITVVVRKN